MAGIRIDNASDDGITVFLDGQEYIVAEDEKLNVSDIGKGRHTVRIHRTRVPEDISAASGEIGDISDLRERAQESDKSVHTQLDAIFEIEMNSSKAVLTVNKSILSVEKYSTDALFSGYSLTVTGSRILNESKKFANRHVQRKFVAHQLKNAFVPIGIGGIIFLLLGIAALVSNINGKAMEFGTHEFTMPWAAGIIAIGLACLGYVAFVTIKTINISKKYSTKNSTVNN